MAHRLGGDHADDATNEALIALAFADPIAEFVKDAIAERAHGTAPRMRLWERLRDELVSLRDRGLTLGG